MKTVLDVTPGLAARWPRMAFGLILLLGSPLLAAPLQFNRDIRPILADNCFACHGPDGAARKADLRLDHRGLALKGGKSGAPALVPEEPGKSELVRRISSKDPDELMPPTKSNKQLTPAQIVTLKTWIAEGASYQGHWAFAPPSRIEPPVPPASGPAGRPIHPIDAFVRSRLEQERLPYSKPAPPATLIRRLSLDLTGLPPTPAESAAFEQASALKPNRAYDELVARLLDSQRFGEHMAARWLDLARYADTSGFQGDPLRTMWRWRDYVIGSFNQNKPFDRFTLEQIAGDLLPEATPETRLATGFHRNHRFNTEFGAIDEEWKVENVVDRVETVSAAWLALTMGCARCHDHKYDPVSQREFYQFFAFFNHVPERGVYWDIFGADAVAFEPSLRAPVPADAVKLKALDQKIARAQADLERYDSSVVNEFVGWDKSGQRGLAAVPMPPNLVLHLPFDDSFKATFGLRSNVTSSARLATNRLADGRVTVVTNQMFHTNLVRFAETLKISAPAVGEFHPSPVGRAWRPSSSTPLLISSNVLDQPRVSLTLWIGPDASNGVVFTKMGRQKLHALGISLTLTNARLRLEIAHEQFDFDGTMVPAVLTTQEPLPLHEWTHVAVVLDGTRHKRGPTLFLNGRVAPVDLLHASARGLPSFSNLHPLLLGGSTTQTFTGWLDDFRIYDRTLTDAEVQLLARWRDISAFSVAAAQRSPPQQELARAFYRDFISSTYAAAREGLEQARAEKARFEETLPLVMVMADKPGVPAARVLGRGQYDAPGETVPAGVPAALGTLPAGSPSNRLGLARWLISPDNPLTARVFVNRLWEQFFGTGLVRTSENLGIQSEPASHPELLDWLAAEFVARSWDVKSMIKLIVTSATYRQASVAKVPETGTPHPGLERDLENRLLWRGPRFRLSAEAIRDRALAASGLLQEQVGGPSVTPYLPGERPSASANLYRRSLYSFWQRTRFNPSLGTFDAPSREACTVRRPRTNTPLQALALMNEVTYVEAARRLAERMMTYASIPPARLRHGFQLALCREPEPAEMQVLLRLLDQNLARFRADAPAAAKLIALGAAKADAALPQIELAAHTMVASALLNLDEFVTKD
jgi:Protein of unknown function (DUF1553)/Protein of unknown function (DUF1549)/Planctomycete cytochrome C/Concanavalin A-like lectin/glucanases superfamily